MEARPFGESLWDERGLMRAVVVHNDVGIQFGRHVSFGCCPGIGGIPENDDGDAIRRSHGLLRG